MSTPYLSEIKLVAFNFAPQGWLMCNGQLLPINQYAALFSLMGTTYGGNGVTTFALPNLQGRAALHFGAGYTQGQIAGEVNVTLNASQLPAHTHLMQATSATANVAPAAGHACAASTANPYAATPNTTMNPAAVANVGGSQPHPNMPPYLVMNYIIAAVGIFPSRN